MMAVAWFFDWLPFTLHIREAVVLLNLNVVESVYFLFITVLLQDVLECKKDK